MGAMADRTTGAVFGREPELAQAQTFLAAAGERFAAMVVEGEPGIGKTTVWCEVARRAEDAASGFSPPARPRRDEARALRRRRPARARAGGGVRRGARA